MTLHVREKSLALSIHHPFTVKAKFEAWSSGRGQESAGGQLRLGEGTRIHLGRVLFQVFNGTNLAEINWSWADHGCLTTYYTYIHTVLDEQSGLFKHQILQASAKAMSRGRSKCIPRAVALVAHPQCIRSLILLSCSGAGLSQDNN